MNLGRAQNSWWRYTAVGCFAFAATNVAAQQRYQNFEDEFNWFSMRITEVFLGVEVEGRNESSLLNGQKTPYHSDYFYAGPVLGLGLQGSVYHPNLLQFNFLAEDGIGWQEQTISRPVGNTPAGTESKTRFLQRYHGDLSFLKEKPYAVYVSADKDHNFRQYDFYNQSVVDNERYGGRTGYTAGPVPFRVGYNHLEESVVSYNRTSLRRDDTLLFEAHLERKRNATTTFSYSIDDFENQEFGIPVDQGTYYLANFYDTETFGKKEQVRLNSSLFYNRLESPTTPNETLSLQENGSVEHNKELQSNYQYSFIDQSSGSAESTGQQAQAGLSHQLYESLVSSVDLHGNTLDATSPGASSSITRYGLGLSEAYTKNLGGKSRLSLGYSGRFDQEQDENTGAILQVIDEPHTLTDGIVTYLNQPEVVIPSVEVTDSSGRTVYRLLLDYQLIPNGALVEIRRVPGSTIPNGGSILADYTVAVRPSDSFTTIGNQVSFRLDLFDNLVGLYARWNVVNNHGGETLVLQNINDRIVGTDFTWRWLRAGAEYEDYESNLAPYTAARLFQSLSFDLGREDNSTLSFNFNQAWTTYEDSATKQASYDFICRFRTRFTRYLSWTAEGGVHLNRGPGFDQTLWVARTGLEYSRGQLAVTLAYDHLYQDYLGELRQGNFLSLRAKRTF